MIKTFLMKKIAIIAILTVSYAVAVYSQYSAVIADPSYRYVSSPGFVNIIEFVGAKGLEDSAAINADYYFGVTNVFGYQIDKNFLAGIGIGFYHYDDANLFPLYLEYKYSHYFKRFTPYFYGDGGILIKPSNFTDESKIFINPGIGLSRAISPTIELNLSVGYMMQARSTLTRVSFVNFKLGLSIRKNSFRMFRRSRTLV